MQLDKILCPKCGEPARSALLVMTVKVPVIFSYDSRRDVDYADYYLDFDRPIDGGHGVRLGQVPETVELMCGGNHTWTANVVGDE